MKKTTIMVFGDSIAYGANDVELGGWVNRLRLYLDSHEKDSFKVFNLGISGETSEETLNRFEPEFCARFKVNSGENSIVIFAVGINDAQYVNGQNRVEINKFQANIQELISKAKRFTHNIFFVGLTKIDEAKVVPFAWNKAKSLFNEKIARFDNSLEETCCKEKVSYLKMFDLLSLDELDDGLHPNSIGHQKMFCEIFKKVMTVV